MRELDPKCEFQAYRGDNRDQLDCYDYPVFRVGKHDYENIYEMCREHAQYYLWEN